MQVDKSDFVILTNEKNKKVLAKIISVDPSKAIICDKYQTDKDRATYVEFNFDDVVANLGKKPKFGSSYGVDIEYVREVFEMEPWSDIYVYRKLNETEHKMIFKSLSRCAKTLTKAGLFPKEKPIEVIIKEKKGMFGGNYRWTNKEDKPDVMTLKPSEFMELDSLIYHEIGHGVWYQMMDEKLRARWIRMFYQNVKLVKDTLAKMKKMRKELIEHETVKAYRAELDDEEKEIFQSVLDYIERNFDLNSKHINTLISDEDDLTEIWPDEVIALPHKNILVTDYALTDPEELFSESFKIHFDPAMQLPKSVQKLMDKTIDICKYGGAGGKTD